ncbi:ComEC/Rec2 family competence protein [Novosphingobium sp. Chol11]|uniref:ComEC/Rec2 family competence protein n=1 Tax=Novosphingobium sp. Chol11 TaxID=1385763 RepID=UPI0025E78966|nr:ComEC/Rec2 family competence protein [Novosphingobium sp. Chol11]
MAEPVPGSAKVGAEIVAAGLRLIALAAAAVWGNLAQLSSMHRTIERFLMERAFERGPWLAVAFAAGIAGWTVLEGPADWAALMALCGAVFLLASLIPPDSDLPYLRQALLAVTLMVAAGCATIWAKSALVGEPGIAWPEVSWIEGEVLDRQDERAQGRIRLVLAGQVEGHGQPLRLRINVPVQGDLPALAEGARVRLRARLMPPAAPMLPGAYNFARTAWFAGLAATGNAIGPVEVLTPATDRWSLRQIQQRLADHVSANLSGSPGAIAAALASGDRGAIAQSDEDAMRDAGLTHLLSISGLHVSAVIAAVYVITIRMLALFPYIALRVRLPVFAAAAGALGGIAYTLVTGSEVPTIRSVAGSLLVLAALALGRDPLSLRLLATAALFVMLFWPESVFGPGFQMSFASVIAIIAFYSAAPAKAFLAAREEGWLMRTARHLLMLLASGVVIELALMPISLFHFHRAGLYGAAANVIAIPLTTFATMPLVAIALLLDLVGVGAPAWWLVGKSLELLLWLAHVVAAQPGAVTMMPGMPGWTFGLFVAGLLWAALWTGRVRLWGFVPIALATAALLAQRTPDVLVSGDGRHVGITGEGPDLLVLRDMRGDYTRDAMLESAGMDGQVTPLDSWRGAQCNPDFCRITAARGGRRFVLLMARGRDLVERTALEPACAAADIVIASRRLPLWCKPRLLKADREMLRRTGGVAISLISGEIRTVAETQGQHGWNQQASTPSPRYRRPYEAMRGSPALPKTDQ